MIAHSGDIIAATEDTSSSIEEMAGVSLSMVSDFGGAMTFANVYRRTCLSDISLCGCLTFFCQTQYQYWLCSANKCEKRTIQISISNGFDCGVSKAGLDQILQFLTMNWVAF
jgi:hypothetical protein